MRLQKPKSRNERYVSSRSVLLRWDYATLLGVSEFRMQHGFCLKLNYSSFQTKIQWSASNLECSFKTQGRVCNTNLKSYSHVFVTYSHPQNRTHENKVFFVCEEIRIDQETRDTWREDDLFSPCFPPAPSEQFVLEESHLQNNGDCGKRRGLRDVLATASRSPHWPGTVTQGQWELRSAEPEDASGKQTIPAHQQISLVGRVPKVADSWSRLYKSGTLFSSSAFFPL